MALVMIVTICIMAYSFFIKIVAPNYKKTVERKRIYKRIFSTNFYVERRNHHYEELEERVIANLNKNGTAKKINDQNDIEKGIIQKNIYSFDYHDVGFREHLLRINDSINYTETNIRYFYLFDYLPLNYSRLKYNIRNFSLTDSEILVKVREDIILKFKQGEIGLELAGLIAFSILKEDVNIFKDKSFAICMIPSSTAEKNSMRFNTLLYQISYYLNITNGYSYFKRIKDRDDTRVIDKRNVDTFEGIEISSEIRGKKIILIDDVITSGKSLYSFERKLGRNIFMRVFLSATIDHRSFNNAKNYENYEVLRDRNSKFIFSDFFKRSQNTFIAFLKDYDSIIPMINSKLSIREMAEKLNINEIDVINKLVEIKRRNTFNKLDYLKPSTKILKEVFISYLIVTNYVTPTISQYIFSFKYNVYEQKRSSIYSKLDQMKLIYEITCKTISLSTIHLVLMFKEDFKIDSIGFKLDSIK